MLDGHAAPTGFIATQDGAAANLSEWHLEPAHEDERAYLERHGATGREYEGFVHRETRKLLSASPASPG